MTQRFALVLAFFATLACSGCSGDGFPYAPEQEVELSIAFLERASSYSDPSSDWRWEDEWIPSICDYLRRHDWPQADVVENVEEPPPVSPGILYYFLNITYSPIPFYAAAGLDINLDHPDFQELNLARAWFAKVRDNFLEWVADRMGVSLDELLEFEADDWTDAREAVMWDAVTLRQKDVTRRMCDAWHQRFVRP